MYNAVTSNDTVLSSSRQPNQDELDSSCFHHPQKKCAIVWYPVPKKDEQGRNVFDEAGKRVFKNIVMCKTHKVRICYAQKECFFEIGTHFNQLSLGYQAPYSLDNYPYDEANENPIESLV